MQAFWESSKFLVLTGLKKRNDNNLNLWKWVSWDVRITSLLVLLPYGFLMVLRMCRMHIYDVVRQQNLLLHRKNGENFFQSICWHLLYRECICVRKWISMCVGTMSCLMWFKVCLTSFTTHMQIWSFSRLFFCLSLPSLCSEATRSRHFACLFNFHIASRQSSFPLL